ncbi:hypothetical protein SAMN05421870_103186 [Streptomyces qinglanensis]|uniref:Uncharacterized protein n=1 Tax=Streptomyces qinglanensis TaxID=943816 RepID=A0A1H9QXX3_9ACTN|nr:hypothetical protein SAMN05421870_103186 [Streptomyces qinglanensis]
MRAILCATDVPLCARSGAQGGAAGAAGHMAPTARSIVHWPALRFARVVSMPPLPARGGPAREGDAVRVRARRWLLGAPLRSSAFVTERIRKALALPVLAADALSSVAYGSEALLAVLVVMVLLAGNMHGVRQAGALFAAPTYAFIAARAVLIAAGVGAAVSGSAPAGAAQPTQAAAGASSVGVLLIVRAFSGATAMTGIEAISNAVPVFRPVSWRNARTALSSVIALLAVMFTGIVVLIHLTGVVPRPHTTVLPAAPAALPFRPTAPVRAAAVAEGSEEVPEDIRHLYPVPVATLDLAAMRTLEPAPRLWAGQSSPCASAPPMRRPGGFAPTGSCGPWPPAVGADDPLRAGWSHSRSQATRSPGLSPPGRPRHRLSAPAVRPTRGGPRPRRDRARAVRAALRARAGGLAPREDGDESVPAGRGIDSVYI